jgi:hypothetical protein
MAYEAKALVTTLAKQYEAEGWAYGLGTRVKYFSCSAGGHDPLDPVTALAADPAATSLPGTVLFGPEAIDSIEWESAICPKFVCQIDQGEFTGEISSVGLIGEITCIGFLVSASVSRTFSFVDNTPAADTITCSSGSFVADGFAAGMYVTVDGTTSNDGTYEIATVAAATITLVAAEALTAEGPLNSATLNGGFHPSPPELGTQYLFAIYNRPRLIITPTDGPTVFKLMPFL